MNAQSQSARPEPMTSWVNRAAWIPVFGVAVAWVVSNFLFHWLIRCNGALRSCSGNSVLAPLRAPLSQMDFSADSSVRAAYDAGARFAWQPTLVAFVVVALGTILACWYLVHRALEESVPLWYGVRKAAVNVSLAEAALLLALASTRFPQWIVHTEVLTPTLEAALGRESPAVRTAEHIQALFQALAFVASCFVVAAASAALLVSANVTKDLDATQHMPPAAAAVEMDRIRGVSTRHLMEQWRRLSLTLFAGAALLVSAVVHQTALYGWGDAFTRAMAETREVETRAMQDSARQLRAEFAIAKQRFLLDSASGVSTVSVRARQRDTLAVLALRAEVALKADSLTQLASAARVQTLRASMTRVSGLVTVAITRGGGLIYTILLAMTYLPAALVLMERAWEISYVVKPDVNASDRADWRAKEGIGFSFGTQWSKIFAVLSPLLASSGAAVLFELLK